MTPVTDRAVGTVVAEPTFLDHFSHAVATGPDRIAISLDAMSISYRTLDRRAAALARRLQALGCEAERVVGVSVERSAGLVVALLGVLKSGAAFLPIDPHGAAERARALVRQSGAAVVVTTRDQTAVFASCGVAIVCVDALDAEMSLDDGGPARGGVADRANLAYVIYTSGSTGTPKGVAVTHDSFSRYLRWALSYYAFDPSGVSVVHTSIAFDLTLTSIFAPLLAGMRLVMVPERDGLDAVVRLLDERREPIALLKLTPSHLRLMAETRRTTSPQWRCDVLIVGGEPFTASAARFWDRSCPGTRIFNEYGPTEATVGCAVAQARVDADGDAAVPIGVAIDDVVLRVESEAPTGTEADEGELFIGGPCLARGYLGAAAITAQQFVPDPRGQGDRLYRTGDWVRDSGSSEGWLFAGRRDRQRKINGVRVELDEIETVLRGLPGVQAAAVVEIRDGGQETIAAFLAVHERERTGLDVSTLTTRARARLVAAAVPTHWFVVDALPLARSGKVDYRTLVRERHRHVQLREAFLPPRNPMEELLASLWRTVLDHEEIGIDDSFFALDGNSMKSIQFVYQAQKHGLSLTTRDLFQHQTIRRLAEVAARASATRPAVALAPFALVDARDRGRIPADVVDAYPLAMLQAGTLFESDSRAGSGTYHNVNSYHVECDVDVARLRQSVRLVTARHPILRTAYDYVNYSTPLQLVARDAEIPLQIEDISLLAADVQTAYIGTFIEEESRRAFDWTRVPLLRLFVHVRGPRRMQFTLSKHHSILDGWSAATLMAEIVKNYFALIKQQPPPFQDPVETTYRDFVALEQQALQSAEFRDFWRDTLHEAPYHALQAWGSDAVQRDASHSSIATRTVAIPLDLSARLKEVARRAQTPLKSVLLAVHLRVIAQVTGSSRVVTGVVSHGRPESVDADKAIGLFINTIPFHLTVDERDTWIDWVARVFGEERRVFPYQRYPMARIKKDLGWERPFDSIFYYTNFHVFRDFRSSDELRFIDSTGFEETEIPFTAAFSLHPLSATVSLALHFHVDHFTEPQIANVASYYETALAAIVEAPDQPLRSRSLLTAADARAARVERTVATRPAAATVFDLVQAQAKTQPDAIAMAAGARRWSYGALCRCSARWGRVLQQAGVGADSRVAVHVQETPDAILAMLAVASAGGCFVVLDAQWPEQRLADVLRELQPTLVLTDSVLVTRTSRWPYPSLDITAPLPAIDDGARVSSTRRDPAALAYIIFTSGSTGRPKGVMVSHANLVESTRSRFDFYGDRYERFLLLSPLTFDSSCAGLWGTLCGGGTLHVVPERRVVDVDHVAGIVVAESMTHFLAIPSLYRVLLPELTAHGAASLRAVIAAGEALTPDLVREHATRLPAVTLYNEYGPTEATVWATAGAIADEAGSGARRGVSIGRALPHAETLILDDRGQLVSLGVVGELYVGGAGIARGYHESPAATAQRFVPNSCAATDRDAAMLYRTGDLVRARPNGELEFVGRADHQVKVRGVRIEPEEIERAFRLAFTVSDVMVDVVEDAPGRKTLRLSYVRVDATDDRQSTAIDRAQVRAALGRALPAALLPDDVQEVESLPRLANGKLDRRAASRLRARSSRSVPIEIQQPSSELQRALAGVWREVLGVDAVGVTQNFFDIGGDSLLANQIVLRAAKVFGAKVPLKDFYQRPTVAAHADFIKRQGDGMGLDLERVAAIWNQLD